MKRRLSYISAAFAASVLSLGAREKGSIDDFPRLTFGAEWGYTASFWSGWHYNFFSSEGYRIDDRGRSASFRSNAEAYLHIGYNLDCHWNISFHAGYAGLGNYHKAVPMSFRLTRYFGHDPLQDRWFAFADLGTGVCLKPGPQEIFTGKAGGGWRMSLSRETKLDFLLSARAVYTHPEIIHGGISISSEKTNRNEACIVSLTAGVSLTF